MITERAANDDCRYFRIGWTNSSHILGYKFQMFRSMTMLYEDVVDVFFTATTLINDSQQRIAADDLEYPLFHHGTQKVFHHVVGTNDSESPSSNQF